MKAANNRNLLLDERIQTANQFACEKIDDIKHKKEKAEQEQRLRVLNNYVMNAQKMQK